MSMKYLGESFDIHTGGMDLRFPHHENEIAQSEAATGKKFVNYWLHSQFLTARGEEMHKSLGNVVSVRDLVASGWEPMTIRLFLISSSYRDPMDLTDKALEQARAQRNRLSEFVSRLRSSDGIEDNMAALSSRLLSDFETAMDDDLNTPKAFSVLFAFVKKVNSLIDSGRVSGHETSLAMAALERVNAVLGVIEFGEEPAPPGVVDLIAKRDEARKRKDFEESDRIRKELLALGVELEDTPKGTRWKRIRHG
jgi:cysteinyl-tRNA synthetase